MKIRQIPQIACSNRRAVMIKFYEKCGKTEDAAITAALADLGLERDQVSVEVLERAKSGFLGIGAAPAKIRMTYEVADEVVEEVVEKPKAKKAEKKPEAKVEKKTKETVTETVMPETKDETELRAVEFVAGLLERMGVKAKMELSDKENGDILINLSGDGMGAVIGRRGETLDAIQHLTNYSVNRGSEKRRHISIDAESYRAKREDSLVHLAEKMAAKAIKYKRSMALEPMNSYERHVIHTALQNYEGVTTSSIGSEPNRRVVVSCDKAKPVANNRSKSQEWG